MIKIVGLGAGDISQISMGAYDALKNNKEKILLRTEKHPIVDKLGIEYESFDSYYDGGENFEEVYEKISCKVVEEGRHSDIVYAVPGHPRVAEKTVSIIEKKSVEENIDIEVIPSMSFVDAMYSFLGFDPSEGFRLIDAFDVRIEDLDVSSSIIITQVYDRFIASNVKLKLMEYYEDETPVWIVKSAGIKDEEYKKEVHLWELDMADNEFDHLTSLYIPRGAKKIMMNMGDIRAIVDILRGEGGCEWDRSQSSKSLIKYIREETEEVCEAIESEDIDSVIEELGDLLLHIIFQCRIGKEEGFFSLEDVTDSISRKMIRRHPHIFSEIEGYRDFVDPDLMNLDWETIKKSEKK